MADKEEGGLMVASVAFSQGGNLPKKYTCEGEDINPPLSIQQIPEGAKSLVLIVEDHDAPGGIFDHWLVWNIPVNEPIAENRVPGISGKNSFGKTGYGGPCPPEGAHRYFFKAYALDMMLELPGGSDKAELLQAIEPHILATGEIMVYYKKSRQPA